MALSMAWNLTCAIRCSIRKNGRAYTLEFRLKLPLLRRRRDTPFLWFPWFGNFDKESVRAELLTDKKVEFRQGKVPESLLREYTPEHFVNAGDKLIVERLERQMIDGPFSHEHDHEVRLAFLCIIRANGKRERVKTPLMFTGATSLFVRMHKKEWFDKITRRICEHFNLGSFDEIKSFAEGKEDDKSYAYSALLNALSVKRFSILLNVWTVKKGWEAIELDKENIGFNRSEEKRREPRASRE